MEARASLSIQGVKFEFIGHHLPSVKEPAKTQENSASLYFKRIAERETFKQEGGTGQLLRRRWSGKTEQREAQKKRDGYPVSDIRLFCAVFFSTAGPG
jgi:hypothetical protein